MALQDLAQRSGFTHAIDGVVLLQLELPASQPELRELFSCQLVIDDGQNEWRVNEQSSLYQQLQANIGSEGGVIGTVHIPSSAFRNNDVPEYRTLTLFGRQTLFRYLGNYGYTINARVRCLSVERRGGRIWFVRGEILSGGLILDDPRVIDDDDRNRVWPSGNLRGIFFTGSELQIEVGEKIREVLHGFLPPQPTGLPENTVRINQPSQSGQFLFHAHLQFPNAVWGDWKKIISWDGTQITVDVPYTPETKPDWSWHYEIYRLETVKRYRLAGTRKAPEKRDIQRVVWEQIPATGSLSQFFLDDTHGPLFEPPNLPIQPPEKVAAKLLGEVQALCFGDNQISIAAGASGLESASRPIDVVDNMDGAQSQRRELLRVDWKVTVKLDLDSDPVDWHPRTLKVTTLVGGAKQYELLDSDAVEAELRGYSSNNAPDARVSFTWDLPNGTLTPTIPPTRLIAISLDADRRPTEETCDTSRELWFQASCDPSTPYPGLPLGWANITAQQPPAIPVGDGARAARLNGPIQFKTAGWAMQAVPADPESGRATATPGVRLTLTQTGPNKSAKLELLAADVTLDSSQFRIYDKPINDPKSVPNERRPQDDTTKTSLRFIHRPEWERVPPENDNAVVCKHEVDRFVLSRTPQAVRLYLPAERALIDPVSVTRGNLVGRQIVAFPLLVVPDPQSSGVTLTVTDVRVVTNSDKTLEAHVVLEIAGGSHDSIFKDILELVDFFAQFELASDDVIRPVLRIRKLEGSGATRTLIAPIQQNQPLPKQNTVYSLTIGPTRLALPRDVNHGLTQIGVSEFQLGAVNKIASLAFGADKIRGEEVQSVLALHPWSEWGPSPNGKPWLTTGRVRLHHRNLIQEHAEFESSFEDRFPPEGPAKNPDGSIPSPLLPLVDFVRAVRDRYTEATGNLVAPAAALPTKAVRNWVPNSKLSDDAGQAVNPRVEIELKANDLTVLPEAKVRTELDIAEDPFSFKAKISGIEHDFYQSLKLRKATEPGADQHWLGVSVRPTKLEIAKQPELRLEKTDPTDVTSRRAVDSSVPLLFSRHDICALATIGLDDGRCIAIVGSPEQPAKSYLLPENGSVPQTHAFPGNALVDVALLRHGGTIRGLAIRKTNSGVELIRFTVNSGTGAVDDPPTTISTSITGTPRSLACTPEEPNATIFLLTFKPGVFTVHAETGAISEIAGAGDKATAIGVDRVENVHYLAVGTSDGTMSVWHDSSGTWEKQPAEGQKREENSPILGKVGQKVSEVANVKDLAARFIRGLCVLGDASQPIVIAVDGTRFPCVWDTNSSDKTQPEVWLQSSGALCVSFGRVVDLEQRKSTETVPLFALGLRSGTVRVSATLGRAEGLTDIRQFDTAETPITRLTLVGSDNTTKPAVCFAGTSSGSLLAWDTRRGMQWQEVERTTPKTYLDGLGVVRAVPSAAPTTELTVDNLSLGTVEYRSVTTRGLDLVVDNSSGMAADNITDIRLWADSFKVRADGTVEPKQFPDGPFDSGHIAFFSNVIAKDNLDSLAALNHVPRLSGIPFYVTGVKMLKLNTNRTNVESAVVEGVLVNPDEVGAGQDPADMGTLLGIVVRALSRCQPIEVTLESGSWTVTTGSQIDWACAVNRQNPDEHAEGFPGAVARIVGTVSKTMSGRLSIEVDGSKSRALIFGRLWPFAESVTIHSHASFERGSNSDLWKQSAFSFRSEGDAQPFLHIRSEEGNFSPKARLEVDFGSVEINDDGTNKQITGHLYEKRRMQFKLEDDVVVAQFEQGGYRCLLLPSQKGMTADVVRGQGALILWTAGDLSRVGNDAAVGPLRLCAAYVKLKVASDATEQAGWMLTAGASAESVSCRVHQSLLTVTVNDDRTSKLVAQHGTVLIETTLHGQQKATFLLEGNVQTSTKELTGLLILEEQGKVVQATVRAKLDLSARTLVLTDDVFWATFVRLEKTFLEPEVLMPTPSGGTASTQFSVNSYTVDPLSPFGFVRLCLKKLDSKLQMGIRPVKESEIPLLPELEPSLVQAPERIGSNEVRLAHRLRAGLALRPNAPLDRFGVALATPTSGEPSLPTLTIDRGLLLETVVSTSGPLVRLRPEGWLVPKDVSKDKAASADNYRTDGLFVLNVDFRRNDIPVVAAVEARTRKLNESEPEGGDESKRYGELLRAAGSQGVAITYRLNDGQIGDLGFVASPFYDHPGETAPVCFRWRRPTGHLGL